MSTNKKNINIEEIFQAIIIFCIASVFLLSILTGNVYKYVNKSHIPMIIFSVIIFVIAGIVKLNHALKYPRQSKKIPFYFLLFIFTIFVYFFMIPIQLKISSLTNTGNISAETMNYTTENNDKNPLDLVNGVIHIETYNFYKWIVELNKNIDKYVGTAVEVDGEVLLSDNFNANQFGVARMMMVCCAADMQITGLICELDDISDLQDGSWVTVKGTIKKSPYEDTFEPIITVTSVIATERPKSEYVTPY